MLSQNLAAVIVSFVVFYMLGAVDVPRDLPMFYLGYFFMIWWATAIALIIGALSEPTDWVQQIWQPYAYTYMKKRSGRQQDDLTNHRASEKRSPVPEIVQERRNGQTDLPQQVVERANAANYPQDYANWVRLYDTINDEDREAIAKALDEMTDRPLISVVEAHPADFAVPGNRWSINNDSSERRAHVGRRFTTLAAHTRSPTFVSSA